MKIVKCFEFEMAHCLDGHNRGCNNVHGHSYKLEVCYEISNLIKEGSSEGMGIDFGDLKKQVEFIIDKLDHSFLYNWKNDNETKIAFTLRELGKKVNELPCRTTSENIAMYILSWLPPEVCSVKLYETSTSYVIVDRKDLNSLWITK